MNGLNPKSRCFFCGRTWGNGNPEDGFTDGLCPVHIVLALVPIYRARQEREKNFPCFGRSNGYCDQVTCKYRSMCLSPERPPAHEIEVFLIQNPIDRFSSHRSAGAYA